MNITAALEVIKNSKYDKDCPDPIYEGITILRRYHKELKCNYSFYDDQLFVGVFRFETYIAEMSDEDIVRMASLGWFESEDSWATTL